MNYSRIIVLTGMIVAAAISRMLPHPPNFTPLVAVALFGGAYFEKKYLAYAVPLVAMVLSDIALAFLYGYAFFTPMRLVVYACFAAITSLGFLLRGRTTGVRIGAAALASSGLFFLITNFAVWVGGGLYPMTAAGLGMCYVAAIPFFQNEVFGTMFYTAVLFGGFEFAKRRFPLLAQV